MTDPTPQKSDLEKALDELRAQPSEATVSVAHVLKILELLAAK